MLKFDFSHDDVSEYIKKINGRVIDVTCSQYQLGILKVFRYYQVFIKLWLVSTCYE